MEPPWLFFGGLIKPKVLCSLSEGIVSSLQYFDREEVAIEIAERFKFVITMK